jgi:hypothetical protein
VKRFLNFAHLPFRLERDSHKHDRVNFSHLQVDANSISITIGACDDGHLPILEPIVGFQLSCALVEKFVKLLMNMVCGILNVELSNPVHLMQCFAKEHQP